MDYDSDDDIGASLIHCDRNSPDFDYYKPMADLAIDFYNQQTSKEYRAADLIRLDGSSGIYTKLYMRFTAKLDNDSDDAATFASYIVISAGEETTKIEYARIC